jgi:drug/metabolite transporter (DMT)-like permease
LGVSGFLILIAQVESDSPFLPLVIARLAGVVVAVLVLAGAGTPWLSLRGNPWALGAGMLDAAGNVAYVVAVHHLRVDLAAVLSSLYPAVTVLLALRFMHQALRSRQWLGLALCLGGLGLIST